MASNHQWVTFTKGHIHVNGCAECGQILLPTNAESECQQVPPSQNILIQKGYRIVANLKTSQVA
ncbi:MAG: hypothetical protein V2I33_10255 [Kangiellaceae bacterium]|nr:hypothetical protein [Kangiellaceae bacterium]